MLAYVEQQDGVYRVAGTRVSLDSLVHLFLEGCRPEEIAQSFSTLTLEQVYGALTHFLANRPTVDAYLARQLTAYDDARQRSHRQNASLVARLREARHSTPASS